MEVRAKAKYVRTSPRKVRLVLDVVRGLKAGDAMDQLNFINKLAAKPVKKLLVSAIANGVNNYSLDKDNLYIKQITADEGPTLHRWQPRARGRATPIRKRTSHIEIVLAELVESGQKAAKKKEIAAPVKLDSKPKEDEGVKIKSDKGAEKVAQSPEEKGKKIVDPRSEGRGKHTKIEGGREKGFVNKIFRRKSG
jgi:large subunit ribosomal protein L22